MTTELVVLLLLFATIVLGSLFGEKGPKKVFSISAPRLAARIETQLATGRNFKTTSRRIQNQWDAPPNNTLQGALE